MTQIVIVSPSPGAKCESGRQTNNLPTGHVHVNICICPANNISIRGTNKTSIFLSHSTTVQIAAFHSCFMQALPLLLPPRLPISSDPLCDAFAPQLFLSLPIYPTSCVSNGPFMLGGIPICDVRTEGGWRGSTRMIQAKAFHLRMRSAANASASTGANSSSKVLRGQSVN